MGRKKPVQMRGDPSDVAFFELMESHLPRAFSTIVRRLPSGPWCRLCRAPYGGIGGRIMRRVGFGPSRKNPALCNTSFKKAPMGGVELEIGVLFADVRGLAAPPTPVRRTWSSKASVNLILCGLSTLVRASTNRTPSRHVPLHSG
jgi:hypothetical protein